MMAFRLENRSGKVIALGRVILSASFVIATLTGLGAPLLFPTATVWLTLAYFILSLAMLAATWSNWWLDHRLKLPSHILDLAVFVALNLSVGAFATSPFFPFFVFLVLSASVKWGWRAAIWTVALAAAFFVAEMGAEFLAQSFGQEDYVRLVVRGAHLFVLSFLIAWLGVTNTASAAADASAGRLADLRSVDPPVRQALMHIAECLKADVAALVWSEPDEPWHHVATWSALQGFRTERAAPADFPWLISDALAGQSFLFDLRRCQALVPSGKRLRPVDKTIAVNPALLERIGVTEGVATPLEAEGFTGYFIAGEIEGLCWDDLSAARKAGIDASRAFDRSTVLRASVDSSQQDVRLTLAHDLHDSVAQMMAGIGLKLRAARLSANAKQRDKDLGEIEEDLITQQEEIEAFIEYLRQPIGDALRVSLEVRLYELSVGLARQWNVLVQFSGEQIITVSKGLEVEIGHLIRETVANAVRHGGASQIELSARLDEPGLILRCADNGRGFPPTGRFNSLELEKGGFGPRSVLARVRKLGGEVELVSSATGAILTMTLPLGAIQ